MHVLERVLSHAFVHHRLVVPLRVMQVGPVEVRARQTGWKWLERTFSVGSVTEVGQIKLKLQIILIWLFPMCMLFVRLLRVLHVLRSVLVLLMLHEVRPVLQLVLVQFVGRGIMRGKLGMMRMKMQGRGGVETEIGRRIGLLLHLLLLRLRHLHVVVVRSLLERVGVLEVRRRSVGLASLLLQQGRQLLLRQWEHGQREGSEEMREISLRRERKAKRERRQERG